MNMTMEAQLLSVQITRVESRIYAKAFLAFPADGDGEVLSSVTSMGLLEDKADEIFQSVKSSGIQFGEVVRLSVKPTRGAQNTIRNVVEGIERIARSGAPSPAPQTQAKA